MSFRTWLVTCTSLTMLALAPIGAVRAQDASDPALVAAYQAYQSDQSDANREALNQACIAAGFQSLDDCIAALSSTAPVEQAAPASSSEEAAPAQTEQATPSEESVAPSSSEEAAPVTTEVAPSTTEAAPAATSSEEVTAAPSSETVTTETSASTEASASASADVLGQLQAAVDLYNQGVAELDAGNPDGQTKIDQASATIDSICQSAGVPDRATCLAQFGLELNPLPSAPAQQPSTESSAVTTEPSSAPEASSAAETSSASSEEPVSALVNASEEVTASAVEPLPPDVAADANALLDSEKTGNASSSSAEQNAASSSSEEPAQPAAPPPDSDKAAQQNVQAPPPETQTAVAEKGTERTGDKASFPPIVIGPQGGQGNPDVKVIQPPKNDSGAVIIQIGINIIINNQRQERDRYYDPREDKIIYEDLSRGRVRETVLRPNGSRVVTIYSRDGEVLQRSKITPDGREIILSTYDPRDHDEEEPFYLDPGRDLPPLHLNIPASDYILDADLADEDEVAFFLDKPPVEQVRRIYTIGEVKQSARLRDSVRRLEIGNLTFDTGKATIARSQVGALASTAKAMQKLLAKNPGEVFLIEGHTDAVGSDVSNLVLSDERAATVARILSDFYDIPPENLVTQGYGERYLKVKTLEAEPLNRRVTVKRITPLVSYEASNN